ncbi:hypothetical protein SADUNF_Sadunf05G0039800 [Salix dunnii]|uniref:Uncharacterized protein n=1 Tax=Salix dunnii TaxID=1413687 RepID=A0A835K2D1_9ROSI|nr:hypothetical protein SADUNF_Sadunf05G0039800 [Salix dunnii]
MGDTSKTKMEHVDDLISEGDSDSDDEHDCSTIHVSAHGKRRLRKPWEKILIVEVLGHKVGYLYLVGSEIEGRIHAVHYELGFMNRLNSESLQETRKKRSNL